MRLDAVRRDLRSEIDAQGYFPDLVEDTVTLALAGRTCSTSSSTTNRPSATTRSTGT